MKLEKSCLDSALSTVRVGPQGRPRAVQLLLTLGVLVQILEGPLGWPATEKELTKEGSSANQAWAQGHWPSWQALRHRLLSSRSFSVSSTEAWH